MPETSYLSPGQIDRLLRTRLRAKAWHGMSLSMYTPATIAAPDSMFSKVCKKGHGPRQCVGNTFVHQDKDSGGWAASRCCVTTPRSRH